MRRNLYLGIACTLLLVAGGLYYFLKPESPPPAPVDTKQAENGPAANITFTGSNIIEQENGKTVWEMSAASIEVDPKTKDVQLTNLKGVFYRENGSKVDLTAQKGRIDNKSRDIFVDGEVQAVSSNDGAVFNAAKVQWADKEKHFLGSGGIKLIRGDTVVTGDNIDTDQKMEHMKITGNAHIIKGGVAQ